MSAELLPPRALIGDQLRLIGVVLVDRETPTEPAAPTPESLRRQSRQNKCCEACGEGGRYVVASKCRSCGHMLGEPLNRFWGSL